MSDPKATNGRKKTSDCLASGRPKVGWLASLILIALVMPAAVVAQEEEAHPPSPPHIETAAVGAAQEPKPTPGINTTSDPRSPSISGGERAERLPSAQRTSDQFLDPAGLTVERLVEAGFGRRADLLAARERLAIAEGRAIQAGLRPNPELQAEYGSARFLGGEPESEFDIGVSQVFETGGKRGKRVAVARLELTRTRAEVLALERQFAAEVRASYARAVAAGKQLDALEQLIAINEELARITNERLQEGDVAPVEINLVRVETDRLRAQVVRARAELEGEIISLRALAGFTMTEPLRIAPLPDRPPRLDLSVMELTEIALRERADLQAARLDEELGMARIRLAEAQGVPNVEASVRYSQERSFIDFDGTTSSANGLRDKDNILTFGLAVQIPVFNKNQGAIASAVGERAEAQRQREFLETTIRRDVALAYRRYRAAAEALVLYSTQIVPRSEEIVRSVRAAYGLGEFSIFNVLNEQRRLVESQTGYTQALRDYYAALADLERILGIPLPATGFAPAETSVVPEDAPRPATEALRRALLSSAAAGKTPAASPEKMRAAVALPPASSPDMGSKVGTDSQTQKGKAQ